LREEEKNQKDLGILLSRDDLLLRAAARQELLRRKRENSLRDYLPLVPPMNNQEAFHLSPCKSRWLFGANRSGKTYTGMVEMAIRATGIIPESLRGKYNRPLPLPSDNWIVSLDFDRSRDVAQKHFFSLVPSRMIKSWNKTEHIVELVNGSVVSFKSCDSGATKFQGSVKHNIMFDEEPPKDIYDECFMRVRDVSGDIWGCMTPVQGLTWIYDEVYLQNGIDPDIFAIHFTLDGNPYISETEKNKIKRKFKGVEYDIRVLGKFASRVGLIYGSEYFDPSIHIVEPFPIPRNYYLIGGLDPGLGTTGYLLMAISPNGQKFIIEEIYTHDKTIEENAKLIIQLLKKYGMKPNELGKYRAGLIDPASNQRDPIQKKRVRTEYYIAGLSTIVADNQIMLGIEKCWEALRINPLTKLPGTLIFNTCKHFLEERAHYSWDRVKDIEGGHKDRPRAHQKDHLLDAWRYIELFDPRWKEPNTFQFIPEEGVQNPLTGY